MRRVAGTMAALMLLVGAIALGADPSAVQTSGAPGLKPGDIWTLVLLDEQGAILRSLVIRVSASPARSCRGGKWNRLEILDERPRRDPGYAAEAAYDVLATDVTMDLAINVCDGYLPLHGKITDLGIQGTHGTLGLGGGKTGGRFYGARVPSSLPGKGIH